LSPSFFFEDESSLRSLIESFEKLFFSLITHLPAGRQGFQKMIPEISGFFQKSLIYFLTVFYFIFIFVNIYHNFLLICYKNLSFQEGKGC